ncbi:MAG TPA: hypothetical protein VNQ90_15555 [Chthoniobacteraceae bacterium]|nr:hypothetical protein [Chthoniobacteraceae bacterium]
MKETKLEIAEPSPEVDRINACYGEFLKLGKRNASGLIEQINKARETGILLQGAKAKCRHGEWKLRFKTYKGKGRTNSTFEFDYSTACNFMRVAKALPEPIIRLPEGIRVLTDIYRGMGALPDPEERAGSRPRLEYVSRASKRVNELVVIISKWRETKPLEQWTAQERETIKDQIKPIAELYRELEEESPCLQSGMTSLKILKNEEGVPLKESI